MTELSAALAARIPAMVEDTDRIARKSYPTVEEQIDASVRHMVIAASFEQAIAALEDDRADVHISRHERFGAMAAEAGLALEALLGGYRCGARVLWAATRELVATLDVDSDLALETADKFTQALDRLTTASTLGYAAATDHAREQKSRARQSLLLALLAGAASQDSARRCGWTLTEQLAAAVLREADTSIGPASQVLVGAVEGATVAVAEPHALARALAGTAAALGPAVPAVEVRRSLARARRVATLIDAGAISREARPIGWEDALVAVALNGAPEAMQELAERRLAPLRDVPDRQGWLLDTLEAWLCEPHRPTAIAKRLQLHPQTVHHRLRKLRERFGDGLDDPDRRFELALAVRWTRLKPDPSADDVT